jgi:hypothetical protein
MSGADAERQHRLDLEHLLRQAQFRRFLFRVIQSARIFEAVTDGSDTRHLYHEGRRDLGLDILGMVEAAQPARHDSGLPILTAIQVLLEEAQKAAPEKGGRGTRYDRHEELSPDDDQPDA